MRLPSHSPARRRANHHPGRGLGQENVKPGRDGRSIIEVTLIEGRNRIVRRWVEAMGAKVERLARVSYGPVRLDDLPAGKSRPLTPTEERAIYKAIGMKDGEDA